MASGTQKIYAAVKSYSQRGNLLPTEDLRTFAESRDLDELVTRIKNTRYANAFAKITSPVTAETLESALRTHLADIHYSIYKTSGEPVLKTYYMKFMIWNLKIILKGKVLGKTQEELESKLNLHAEELISQRDIVLKALVAKDLDEAVLSLSETIFGKDIEKAVAAYNESGNIQVFDTFFDKVLTRQLAQSSRKTSDVYQDLTPEVLYTRCVRNADSNVSAVTGDVIFAKALAYLVFLILVTNSSKSLDSANVRRSSVGKRLPR